MLAKFWRLGACNFQAQEGLINAAFTMSATKGTNHTHSGFKIYYK